MTLLPPWLGDTMWTRLRFLRTSAQPRSDDGTRLLGYAFVPREVSGTFDEFFERGELLRLVVVAADTIPRYTIDNDATVVVITEPLGGETTLRLLLRQRVADGEWILENLEVVS